MQPAIAITARAAGAVRRIMATAPDPAEMADLIPCFSCGFDSPEPSAEPELYRGGHARDAVPASLIVRAHGLDLVFDFDDAMLARGAGATLGYVAGRFVLADAAGAPLRP